MLLILEKPIFAFQISNMQLSKNKILITGATQGIGLEMAQRLSALNNEIIAVGRNLQKLQELSDSDSRIFHFACDLSQPDERMRLMVFVKAKHPDMNVLINNAGIQYNYVFDGATDIAHKIQEEVQVNVVAPMQLINALLPIMQKNKSPAIVNVSSGLALVPKASAPVYCASKAAIHIFTKSLRYQLPHFKVFEIISPLVDTQMTQGRGAAKISPERLVTEFIQSFKQDKFEINIHKVKLLRVIHRISPSFADRMMKGVTQ